jgi:hypothetical protein
MIYHATILMMDDEIDEMVALRIGNNDLTCFASICPFPINIGDVYLVDLRAYFIDEPNVTILSEDVAESIKRVRDGFGYSLVGHLKGSQFIVNGLALDSESDFSLLEGLEGKKLRMAVDRLDVEFLQNESQPSHRKA